MNLLTKAWNKVKRFVSNRYEAVQTYFGGSGRSILDRSGESRQDYTGATRKELQDQHEYWVKNSWIVRRIMNLFVQFAVGPTGLQCVPNSSDEAWNEVRMHNFNHWSRSPEISSRLTLRESVIQWANDLFKGEFFVLKRQEGAKQYIQNIDPIRCSTPPHMAAQEGKTIHDGIQYDTNGRATVYWFKEPCGSSTLYGNTEEAKWKPFPASQVIHKFKARRPGQMRGEPEGVAAFVTLHNYEDLQLLEMKASKRLAEIANVVTNAAGEADVAQSRRARLGIAGTDANGNASEKERANYYETALGGKTVYAKTGETVTQFDIERPSLVVQAYWDLLISQICCAYNVPKLLVLPYSLQGTVTRADLDVCTSAFRFNFELIAEALKEVYEWQTEFSSRYDRSMTREAAFALIEEAKQAKRADIVAKLEKSRWIMDGKMPEHYCEVVIRPPRPPNVDVGYNADAMIKELKAGITTYQDIYAERQQDWRQQFRQAAEAEYYKKVLAKEFSKDGIEVTPDEIAKKLDEMVSGGDAKAGMLKGEFDAYGVGVRAGAITPTVEDENFFRAKAGLPALSAGAREAWAAEAYPGTRRPITLTQPDGASPSAFAPAAATTEQD